MAMLEDQFFKKSVMDGDRSEDIRDEAKPAADEQDIELEENQTFEDVVGPPSEAPYVPENRPGRKTGPKGVLADKAAHDKEKRKEADRNAMKAQAALHRLGQGLTVASASVSHASTAGAAAAALKADVSIDAAYEVRAAQEEQEGGGHSGDEGGAAAASHGGQIGDDSYVAASRQARLEALQAPPSGPHGHVHAVKDASDFLDTINGAGPGTFVVVHMHEDFVPECQAINAVLPATAAAASHVLFMTVHASTVKRNFDPIALPSFMVYLNGNTFATEVAVGDLMLEAHGGISPAAVADVLMGMGVPAPLLQAPPRMGPSPAGAPPVDAAASPRSPPGTVRRSSLRPNAAVLAFSGAGSSVHGRLQSAAEAGMDDMD